MKKKLGFISAIVLMLSLLLSACGFSGSKTDEKEAPEGTEKTESTETKKEKVVNLSLSKRYTGFESSINYRWYFLYSSK